MRVDRLARGSLPAIASLCACSPSAPPKSEVDPPAVTAATASASAAVSASVSGPPATMSAKPLSSVVKPNDRVKDALAALEPRIVDDKHIGRRVFFTWTSRQQADAIQAGGRVLTLVESKSYGPAGFDFMLDDEVMRGNALARLLSSTGFAKKRFAWPNAYATAIGTSGARYGTSLLMIELTNDALILDFVNKRVFDVENKEVALSELTAHPERLGAVYWSTEGYREYVLVNETAMLRVSSTTEASEKLREAEQATLAQLTAAMRQLLTGDEKDLLDRFSKTLAFASKSSRESVDRIVTDANTFTPDKLRFAVEPKIKFEQGIFRGRIKQPTCKMQTPKPQRYERFSSFGPSQYCMPFDRCQSIGGKCEAIRRPQWFNDTQAP
jgi:hypothetical protein